jgi:hypothetical protein
MKKRVQELYEWTNGERRRELNREIERRKRKEREKLTKNKII